MRFWSEDKRARGRRARGCSVGPASQTPPRLLSRSRFLFLGKAMSVSIPTCGALRLAAMLLLAGSIAGRTLFAAEEPAVVPHTLVGEAGQPYSWTDADVAAWAYCFCPSARLLESERRALGAQLKEKNKQQRAMIGLIQAVSAELALHQRNEAAADALLVYYRAVATERLLEPLRRAAPPLEILEGLAAATAELEGALAGEGHLLENQRLQLEDRWFQLDFGRQRLGHQLDGLVTAERTLIDRPAVLTSPLPVAYDQPLDFPCLLEGALHDRRDLAALRAMHRCLTEDSLPAVRQLLAGLVPGLGNSLPSRPGLSLLQHHGGDESADLAQRRAQVQQLIETRERQIHDQVRDAILRLQSAQARTSVAQQQWQVQAAHAAKLRQATDLQQLLPGAAEKEELAALEAEGQWILQQQEVAEAVVQLRRACGRGKLVD